MRVDPGGSEIAVLKQFPNRADIKVRLQQVAGKTVTKRRFGSPLADV